MTQTKRSDADYQQEVREFVQNEVQSNVNSLVHDIKDSMDYPFQWYEDNFVNLYDDERDHMKEMYEYWTVSNFLYEKLKAKGEPVADLGSCYVWGRTCTGQAILLDGVICEIYDELQ